MKIYEISDTSARSKSAFYILKGLRDIGFEAARDETYHQLDDIFITNTECLTKNNLIFLLQSFGPSKLFNPALFTKVRQVIVDKYFKSLS